MAGSISGDGQRMDGKQRVVGVFCSSRRQEGTELYREGSELGRLLAEAGYAVLTGGYDGSMAAVSRGAAAAGGRVIGITCACFDPLAANPWVAEEERTPSLMERLGRLMDRADAYIALRGGIGTLCEVTLAWSLIQTGAYPAKPLILLGPEWQHLLAAFRQHTDLGEAPAVLAMARLATSPSEALAALASPLRPAPPSPPRPG
jgi:uncharacterized protein (TIGR00730 family)